jgi:exopolyphosphatase/guanosine-5'-triphosphate,3'-diphosphate pyrophosphatase
MRVAVIDIGSNSIKLLVAQRAPDGLLQEIVSRTLEVRISDGIGSGKPTLGAGPMQRGVAAVAELAADARRLGAETLAAVATSAVRDASNGADFREKVRSAASLEVRLLSGEEEANLIGRGLTTDPALRRFADFDVFDLGGGSLECLSFGNREIRQALSLQLGCVRLTEMFVRDPSLPFTDASARAISAHVRAELDRSGFQFHLPPPGATVGTGGTVSTVRAMTAAAAGVPFDETDPIVRIGALRMLLASVGALPLDSRRRLPGLPPERADVFPAALATLVALAETGGIAAFQNSVYNLRWGLAAEALGA